MSVPKSIAWLWLVGGDDTEAWNIGSPREPKCWKREKPSLLWAVFVLALPLDTQQPEYRQTFAVCEQFLAAWEAAAVPAHIRWGGHTPNPDAFTGGPWCRKAAVSYRVLQSTWRRVGKKVCRGAVWERARRVFRYPFLDRPGLHFQNSSRNTSPWWQLRVTISRGA